MHIPSRMDRPLWQIFLSLFALSFALHRGGTAFALELTDAGTPALFAGYAFQAVAGAAVALGIWTGRRWVQGALVVLGTAVAGTALYEAFFLGLRPAVSAVSLVLVAAAATGALVVVLHRERTSGDMVVSGSRGRDGASDAPTRGARGEAHGH